MSNPPDPRAFLRDWLATGELGPPADHLQAGLIAQAARQQGLSALLHEAIVAEGDAHWPEDVRRGLRNAHVTAFLRGVQQLESVRRVQQLLLERGLRALPLKGAALAESLYDSVAERPMTDVDVLALDDWSASVSALEEAGFREIDRADHAWSFVDPGSDGALELHHSVTSCPGLFPMDAEALWTRSRIAAGQVLRLPSVEDLLVHLSLHAAFQHGLVLSLVQHLDFRRLFERTPPDPFHLLEVAAAARAEASVAAALEVAAAVVGLPLPASLRETFGRKLPDGFRQWLAEQVRIPLSLVAPSAPRLGRVRWELASGRRFELVRRTVASRPPGQAKHTVRDVWHTAARGVSLLRRWVLPALRPRFWRTQGARSGNGLMSEVGSSCDGGHGLARGTGAMERGVR